MSALERLILFLILLMATLIPGCQSLRCHECHDTFKSTWEPQTCQANASATPSRLCNSEQNYCFVERAAVKGIVTKITRDCTQDCRYGCKVSSFGITVITCTSCCNHTDNCNTDNRGAPSPRAVTARGLHGIVFTLCSALLGSWLW